MTDRSLDATYRDYIDCLNRRDWPDLRRFVSEDVRYNGQALGFEDYRAMIASNFADIPDLRFRIGLLVVDRDHVASRLLFNCTPTAGFLGLPVDGRQISFAENVFYRFARGRIEEVWSVIDKAAIEAQLGPRR